MSEVNRTHWDAMAAVHGEGADDYYDVDALVAGDARAAARRGGGGRAAVGDVAATSCTSSATWASTR